MRTVHGGRHTCAPEHTSQPFSMPTVEKQYDIVVYGASGFTGQLCIRYLTSVARQNGTRWAVGGRNRGKLEQALKEAELEGVDIVIADSNDEESLTAMARSTKLVLSLVSNASCECVAPLPLLPQSLLSFDSH